MNYLLHKLGHIDYSTFISEACNFFLANPTASIYQVDGDDHEIWGKHQGPTYIYHRSDYTNKSLEYHADKLRS